MSRTPICSLGLVKSVSYGGRKRCRCPTNQCGESPAIVTAPISSSCTPTLRLCMSSVDSHDLTSPPFPTGLRIYCATIDGNIFESRTCRRKSTFVWDFHQCLGLAFKLYIAPIAEPSIRGAPLKACSRTCRSVQYEGLNSSRAARTGLPGARSEVRGLVRIGRTPVSRWRSDHR